ncbi:hypothetical protein NMY22_g3416 [Coprinellus aureogranulatus]|nr:hypothetical protein NMY22_g3416 [Coprinellus aureogranulatus]
MAQPGPDPSEAAHGGRRGFPQLLLSSSVRLTSFRIVVMSAIMTTGLTIHLAVSGTVTPDRSLIFGIVLATLTTVHHLGTAFGPRLFPLPAVLDMALTGIETICYLVVLAYLQAARTFGNEPNMPSGVFRYLPKTVLLAIIGAWILTLSIVALLVLKGFDFFSQQATQNKPRRTDIGRLPQSPWWRYPAGSIFGTVVWTPIIPGESQWMASARGAIAVISICILTAFGVYHVILAPISEMGMIPHREYTAARLPSNLSPVINDAHWKVVLIWDSIRHPNIPTHLSSVVSASRLPDVDSEVATPCDVKRGAVQSPVSSPSWQIAEVSCPGTYHTNLNVIVDYAQLLGDAGDWAHDVVLVYIGLTEDIDDVYSYVDPILLFQGAHLLTISEDFMVASIKQTITNPQVPVGSNPTTSTLMVAMQPISHSFHLIQDYRAKSVLIGLSALGGLGSFLSTLLAILVGTSLMTALIRNKPFSPLGLLHNLHSELTSLELHQTYPGFIRDMQSARRDAGIVAYIFDTLQKLVNMGAALDDSLHHRHDDTTQPGSPYNQTQDNWGVAEAQSRDEEGTVRTNFESSGRPEREIL